jgi:hypothetical protein
LAPPKAGEKRRRNAKVPAINSARILDIAITAVGRDSHTMEFKIVGNNLPTSKFSVLYSIPGRSSHKNMQLTSSDHYKELIEEAEKKGKP